MRWMTVILLWSASLLTVCGAVDPFARASLSGPAEINVGQKTSLMVDLVIEGYFAGTPAFDFPQISGLIMIPSSFHPIVSNESIDGTDRTVQQHEIFLYARRPGKITIPSIPVRFSFKRQPLDHDPVTVTVQTPPLSFTVSSPPGTEGIPNLISSTDLKVEETWKPVPGASARTGDAFVRTISWSAPDVPGMIFPPMELPTIDGLGVYPGQQEVSDDSTGGKRVDRVTYVCKTAGNFVIPGQTIRWWDPASKQVRQTVLPARSFEVKAPPPPPETVAHKLRRFIKRHAVPMTTGLIMLGILGASFPYTLPLWRQFFRRFHPRHMSPLNPRP